MKAVNPKIDAIQGIVNSTSDLSSAITKALADDGKIKGVREYLKVGREGGDLLMSVIDKGNEAVEELEVLSQEEKRELDEYVAKKAGQIVAQTNLPLQMQGDVAKSIQLKLNGAMSLAQSFLLDKKIAAELKK